MAGRVSWSPSRPRPTRALRTRAHRFGRPPRAARRSARAARCWARPSSGWRCCWSTSLPSRCASPSAPRAGSSSPTTTWSWPSASSRCPSSPNPNPTLCRALHALALPPNHDGPGRARAAGAPRAHNPPPTLPFVWFGKHAQMHRCTINQSSWRASARGAGRAAGRAASRRRARDGAGAAPRAGQPRGQGGRRRLEGRQPQRSL